MLPVKDSPHRHTPLPPTECASSVISQSVANGAGGNINPYSAKGGESVSLLHVNGGGSGRGEELRSVTDPVREAEFGQARRDKKLGNKRASKALTGAILFCFCFMILETAGGMLSRSLAILTDAAHMLTDVAALSLALFALHASSRPANEHYSYGWQRAEAVGALASVFTIWALVGAITVEAVKRVVDDVRCARDPAMTTCEGVDAIVMFGIGCGGLLANFCCAAILAWGGHSHSHSHGGGSHGHSHDEKGDGGHGHSHGHSSGVCGEESAATEATTFSHEEKKAKQEKAAKNLNVRGAFLHALGDCIQSAGVILAAGIIWVYNQSTTGSPSAAHSWANLADPCCSILFGIITLYTTINLFRDIMKILMQGTPIGIDYMEVIDKLFAIEGVDSVHDLHIWSLTQENIVLSVHLVADHHQAPAILEKAQQILERGFNITHSTIQIDSRNVNVSKCATLTFQCAN